MLRYGTPAGLNFPSISIVSGASSPGALMQVPLAVGLRGLFLSLQLFPALLHYALLVLFCVLVLMIVVPLGIRLSESGRGRKGDSEQQKPNASRFHGLTNES